MIRRARIFEGVFNTKILDVGPNLVRFIPLVPGLSSGARGNHPYSGGEVTLVRDPPIRVMLWEPSACAAGRSDRGSLREAAWFPGLAVSVVPRPESIAAGHATGEGGDLFVFSDTTEGPLGL